MRTSLDSLQDDCCGHYSSSPPVVIVGMAEEKVKVRGLVGPATVECHVGRWLLQHEDDYPPWEPIKEALTWEGEEWSSFWSILARRVLEPEPEKYDEAVHTMHVEGQISCDGESMEGPQVMFVQLVKRVVPGAFINRRLPVVCFVMGHSAVFLVHIWIVYKIIELWLIAGAEPAW